MQKIWGIGLSRTGTTSLTKVLQNAGLNIVHYPKEKDMLEGKIDGATDLPVVLHYQKLHRLFPDSKFIFTDRHIDEWVNSVVPYLERKRNWNQAKRQIEIRESIYGSAYPDNFGAYFSYQRHERSVKDYFKYWPNQILFLNIVNGIDKPKKLFDFLGLKNPPEEFPHENRLNK
jgi:hypothetical protein